MDRVIDFTVELALGFPELSEASSDTACELWEFFGSEQQHDDQRDPDPFRTCWEKTERNQHFWILGRKDSGRKKKAAG